jgi:hypothetical protein
VEHDHRLAVPFVNIMKPQHASVELSVPQCRLSLRERTFLRRSKHEVSPRMIRQKLLEDLIHGLAYSDSCQAMILVMTFPATSVSRNRLPLYL